MKSRQAGRVAGLLAAAILAAPAVQAQATASAQADFGRESVSAPLVRFAPNEPLLLVGERTRQLGEYTRLVVSASQLWTLAGDSHFSASARGEWKRSPANPDLDYGYFSVDAAYRASIQGSVLGLGPTLQRQWVVRERFRDVVGVQADMTRTAADDGYSAYYAAVASHRHPRELAELDARVAYASYRRHWSRPVPWLDSIDVDLGLGRERTARGLRDLDNRNLFSRIAVTRKVAGFEANLAFTLQEARFYAPMVEGFAPRRDHYRGIEAGIEHNLAPGVSVRLDYSAGRNRANLSLYELLTRQFSVGLVIATP